jgi:hypothetical protein
MKPYLETQRAISLAPICKGINKLEKYHLNLQWYKEYHDRTVYYGFKAK